MLLQYFQSVTLQFSLTAGFGGYAVKVQFQNLSGGNKEVLYKFVAVTRSVRYNIPLL